MFLKSLYTAPSRSRLGSETRAVNKLRLPVRISFPIPITEAGAVNVIYGASRGLNSTAIPNQFFTQIYTLPVQLPLGLSVADRGRPRLCRAAPLSVGARVRARPHLLPATSEVQPQAQSPGLLERSPAAEKSRTR